jgi:two-component system, OmpR family, sensor kinase
MNTLYGKLALALLGLFCLIGVSFLISARFSLEMYQHEATQRFNRDLARHIASEKPLILNRRVNDRALKEIFQKIMAVNPSIEIYLLNPTGQVLAYSAPPGKVKRMRVALEPIRSFLQGGAPLPIMGDDPRSRDGSKVFSVTALPDAADPQAYLYVILGGEEYVSLAQAIRESYITRLSVVGAGVSLLFALVTGLLLFALLTRRLRRLTAAVEDFQHSDFTAPMEPTDIHGGGDEIDRLATSFKKMADRIIAQVRKLKINDRLRRELVANVSHDLRTPLASVQGYLETLLLKQHQLSAAEQRHYLEVARKHSERLGRLVAELFELAKLDANEVQLHREPFPVAELMHDVAQEFKLRAQNKDISLNTMHNGDAPFVFADLGLIERVFENLIDNALRYTPPGGSISLNYQIENGGVDIEIADTGSGIPIDEIPNVFERFYRSGHHPTDQDGGAGLGLAISKRILELHGSAIRVESAPNTGTVFRFNLPRYTSDASGA